MTFNAEDWTSLSTLHVEPGDVIVVKCLRKITKEQADTLRGIVGTAFPDHKVLVTVPEIDVEAQA